LNFPELCVLVIQRGLDEAMPWEPARDVDYREAASALPGARIPCAAVESDAPSCILYTAGPPPARRDPARLRPVMRWRSPPRAAHLGGAAGETFFSTADIGWVVRHSYTVYGPLLQGMATVIYEGLPVRPDPGVWWRIAEETASTVMFSSPRRSGY